MVNHLKILGCIIYAYNLDKKKRRKFDDKGEKIINYGINGYLKTYKLYNPNTKKTIISGDVIFYEIESRILSNDGVKQNILVD
jgi:hypothetical protein